MSGTVCFYCSVALQSWISQEPVGICWFLVSKVKENMWTLRSFSHCRERKERKRAHLDVNLSSRKGSTCRRDRTYPYELSFYPHECSALLLNVVKTKQDKTKKQKKKEGRKLPWLQCRAVSCWYCWLCFGSWCGIAGFLTFARKAAHLALAVFPSKKELMTSDVLLVKKKYLQITEIVLLIICPC